MRYLLSTFCMFLGLAGWPTLAASHGLGDMLVPSPDCIQTILNKDMAVQNDDCLTQIGASGSREGISNDGVPYPDRLGICPARGGPLQ